MRPGLLQQAGAAFGYALLREADRWFLWVPVLFAGGIGFYFALESEPSARMAVAGVMGAAGLLVLARGRPLLWALAAAFLCAALGFADAMLRTTVLSTPILERPAGAVTIEGWVERVEARGARGNRLTLRIIAIRGAKRPVTLRKARITTRIKPVPAAGQAIAVRAVLRPVPKPVMPGGYDFARSAWFSGIGASGFAISAPEPSANPPPAPLTLRLRAGIDALRKGVDARIRAALPGDKGAIASALITGERGRIPEETLQALRHSGLAHVLAISGLHMALMAGSFYWLARAVMALFPPLALQLPIKKIAAVLALGGASFYLALSGAAIATQRAYLMMAILFLAVLLDRPAITLRNVALAAIIVLALFPESLFDVSFQMSFAAAASLVAVYERWGGRTQVGPAGAPVWRTGRAAVSYVTGIALTTLVASLAVAPFAAFHFHKLAQYGLIANLAAMPLVGVVIMPMALAALLAIPLGLEAWPLWLMGQGVEAVARVAETVSAWDGAVIRVATIPAFTLVALVIGGLWLVLWRERWRIAGLLIAAVGLAFSGEVSRPDMLIARDAATIAVRGEGDQLAAIPGRAGTYSLERWLAAYADARQPDAVRGTGTFACDDIACIATVRGKTVALVLHPAALREECANADIVVAKFPLGRHCQAARATIDYYDLRDKGAHALYLDGQSIRVESVAKRRGHRPWTRAARDQ